ncbi:alpha/beta hydrolase [Enterococcus sp. AZ109]|uniref:alpha/beta hydrolase n=1 Tax=Enterococcus sp. AZ109 TaxID=2774634 RepID=UPI003F20CA09
MKLETIELPDFSASFDLYLRENVSSDLSHLPVVVICPGGGYRMVSGRESEPIALAFLSQGYHALVVDYPVLAETSQVTPDYLDTNTRLLAEVFKQIEHNYEQWTIDPTAIFLLGCSAGGHMAALYANKWQETVQTDEPRYSKPLGSILCYPVIGFNYGWPAEGVLDPSELKDYDTSALINPDTPATFIWHTADDSSVPALNTLKYCEGLTQKAIPFECHLFESGKHGLSLATRASAESQEAQHIHPPVAKWLSLCVDWMERRLSK